MGAETETKTGFSFQKWYEEHGDELNEERRKRYKTDPEYREKVLAQNRKSRRTAAQAAAEERKKEEEAKGVVLPKREWKEVYVEVRCGAGTKMVRAMSVGALAAVLGRSIQAIRALEAQGLIPEAKYRSAKGDRLYTETQIEEIHDKLQAMGRLEDPGRRKDTGSVPYVRMVQFPASKHPIKTAMFRVGALATALDRTVVTVEQMETVGVLPATPFRGSSTGYRLYTLEMIEAARAALLKHGPSLRGKEAQAAFREAVESAWTKQGVFGAKIVGEPGDAP